jgi:ABC-type cobalamin/Fe3+-siderophores transport system ATPase subunit
MKNEDLLKSVIAIERFYLHLKEMYRAITDQDLFNYEFVKVMRPDISLERFEFQIQEYVKTCKNNKIFDFDTEIRELKKLFSNLDLTNISQHFNNFLIKEFTDFNWEMIPYFDQNTIRNFRRYKSKTSYGSPDYDMYKQNFINAAMFYLEPGTHYINGVNINKGITFLQDKVSALKVFSKISSINNNIVLIGANGSGKSSFARALKGKVSDSITIIPAQRILYYRNQNVNVNNFQSMSRENEFLNAYRNTMIGQDTNLVELLTNDLQFVLTQLISEHQLFENKFYFTGDKKESTLVRVFKMWKTLFPQKELSFNGRELIVKTDDSAVYNFNALSDGEKAVVYYISHVLKATSGSYVVVDEPENHLHKALCQRLWDILELERGDCKFIYITHDLEFATARINKTILWNKKFIPPSDWIVEVLPNDDTIPDVLLMELLGSNKGILFCEGDNTNSLDYKVYTMLFKEYLVIPVGGHLNVVNYCKALNTRQDVFGKKALGIIDGDCHLPAQIGKYEEENIYTLKLNEIENLLCDEVILMEASTRFCVENGAVKFKEKFFKEFDDMKEQQAFWYVKNYLNAILKQNFLQEKKNFEKLKTEFASITAEDLDIIFNDRMELITDIINRKDYSNGLKICNFKGALTKSIANVIVNKYDEKIIALLKTNEDLQQKLREKYFNNPIFKLDN